MPNSFSRFSVCTISSDVLHGDRWGNSVGRNAVAMERKKDRMVNDATSTLPKRIFRYG